jgi:hypothetical protein
MRRLGVLLAALAIPLAGGAQSAAAQSQRNPASGTITTIGPWESSLTIQTGGRRMSVIGALTAAANALAKGDYPYVYGGGHVEAGVSSTGEVRKGPGANGRNLGFDCSGSVAAVLSGAGLWPAGSPVPGDAGVVSELLHEHLIARGAGSGRTEVTLYDNAGVHIFMRIDGRYFGTSDGDSNSGGGPGWLPDYAPDAASRSFKAYHVLRPALRQRTTYGPSLTFQIARTLDLTGFAVGDDVHVGYTKTRQGLLTARSIAYAGARTATGTITALASDRLTIRTPAGQSLTFSVAHDPALAENFAPGQSVQVTYTKTAGVLSAHAIAFAPLQGGSTAIGTVTAIAPAGFTIETPSGAQITFSTAGDPALGAELQSGESVVVTYTQDAYGHLIATAVQGAAS